ncbi:hypothetical protein DFR74_112183 [Nocardia puris]|uniref:Uncharacterized protein n=1 Tax=Nocardia puris TaxID=208602 RepID=A0A366DAG3_9NOCA|nr:hypothetical protein DFR74_112183 [Nocardia puris]
MDQRIRQLRVASAVLAVIVLALATALVIIA